MAKQSSNKNIYWIVGIIIIVLVVAGVGYKVMKHRQNAMMYNPTPNGYNNTQPSSPTMSQTTNPGNSGLQNKTGISNQQLQQDTQDVQNSMNQLQQDQGNSNLDTGSQTKDVPQQ